MDRPTFWPPGPARSERPDRPFTGYKLAHGMLSADGTRTGFAGLTLGASRVYGVIADAECVWSRRHAPPRRWCGCGFYCLHDLADARALSCVTENRAALLLEVSASGQYIRYERGVRSSRQRVRSIMDAQCACGRPGAALADAGSGLIGWRHLTPVCGVCPAGRPLLTLEEFTTRLDGPVRVTPLLSSVSPAQPPAPAAPAGLGESAGLSEPAGRAQPAGPAEPAPAEPAASSRPGHAGESGFALLSAEIALLHARLDDLQSRLGPPRER